MNFESEDLVSAARFAMLIPREFQSKTAVQLYSGR